MGAQNITYTRTLCRGENVAAASYSREPGVFAAGVPRIQGETLASAQRRAADDLHPSQHGPFRYQYLLTCPFSSVIYSRVYFLIVSQEFSPAAAPVNF